MASTNVLNSPIADQYFLKLESKGNMMCEYSSYIVFHRQYFPKGGPFTTAESWGDAAGQTIDLFDFSVLHLSSAERLFNKVIRDYMIDDVRYEPMLL